MPARQRRPSSARTNTSPSPERSTAAPQLLGNAAAIQGMQNTTATAGASSSREERPKTMKAWAEKSLQSRFEIVKPGAERTAGNQVTQKEFDEITRTFANIYSGKSDIQFDLDSLPKDRQQDFKMGAMNDIASIMQTKSGRALVDSLHQAPSRGFLQGDRKTTIAQHGTGKGDPSNALGGGQPGQSGTVMYVPGAMHGPDKNLRSDVVLYHEMVHANHAVYNTWDYDPVTKKGGGKKGDVSAGVAESEYQATGLGEHAQDRFSENRYRQERRAIGKSNHGEIRGDDQMAYRNKYLDFAD